MFGFYIHRSNSVPWDLCLSVSELWYFPARVISRNNLLCKNEYRLLADTYIFDYDSKFVPE